MATVIETKAGEASIPRGEIASARLMILGGVAGLEIRTANLGDTLTRVRFEGKRPTVSVADETVVLDFRGFSVPSPRTWFKGGPEVLLCDAVAWTIDLNGGVAGLDADLRSAVLDALSTTDGVTDASLRLPRPRGRIPLQIGGDLTKASIRRPGGVALRLGVSGSAMDVECDGSAVSFADGPWAWETGDFAEAADAYDVQIEGTVVSLKIAAEPHAG